MRKNPSGSVRSFAVISAIGAPNLAKAACADFAFWGSGPMRTSISLVARGCAWKDTAYPPTTKYLTPWALNVDKSSLKSWNIGQLPLHGVRRKTDVADRLNTYSRRLFLPVRILGGLHARKAGVTCQCLIHGWPNLAAWLTQRQLRRASTTAALLSHLQLRRVVDHGRAVGERDLDQAAGVAAVAQGVDAHGDFVAGLEALGGDALGFHA